MTTFFLDFLTSVLGRILILSLLFFFGYLLERAIPAHRDVDPKGLSLNLAIGFYFVVTETSSTILVASFFVGIHHDGIFSLISISDQGQILRAFGLLFAWLAMRDFFYYWFHRLQHSSKWLWAEHSVHHSDEQMNISTGARHHWLEMPLNAIFVVAPLAYLFKPPLITVPFIYMFIALTGFLIHLNVRVGLGRFAWIIANPQNHRIHHSCMPEHIDKNFAQFLPLWDVIFGTYYAPAPDEFPATGLSSGERISTLKKSLIFPFTEWRRMISRD